MNVNNIAKGVLTQHLYALSKYMKLKPILWAPYLAT